MPELPEVENICRKLHDEIQGCKITNVKVSQNVSKFLFKKESMDIDAVKGCAVISVRRRGKYILINCSKKLTLIVHLKMTGKLLVSDKQIKDKHTHIEFKLGKKWLCFNDIRRFGFVCLARTANLKKLKFLERLGPEPLEISKNDFVDLVKSRSRQIKPLLLDQDFIVGLGNIYVDEVLFASGVNPFSIASKIPKTKVESMHKHMQKILKKSIKDGGTTFSDYLQPDGSRGDNKKNLKIYGKNNGEACSKCKKGIVKSKCGSRGTHYCERCQKKY